jgi:hypothetical protein
MLSFRMLSGLRKHGAMGLSLVFSALALAQPTLRVVAPANPHDQAAGVVRSGPESVDVSSIPPPSSVQKAQALAAADALIARQDLALYRGWLKYLAFRVAADATRMGADSPDAKKSYLNLIDWTARITADPNLIHTLRGVQEWAYESQADGSGQPFKISVPTDYDPARPAGLVISCHGYSGNHLEHSAGMSAHPGRFEVAVLGRARGGMYRMLSERDVLDVLAYVKTVWTIDHNRVDLTGGSMGGLASLWLGSRYPDLFACVRPVCSSALQAATENMVNLPVYSVHSDDDPIAFVVGSRGPLQWLLDAGGMVVMDDTTGYGHAVWGWAEGNLRSAAWGEQQVRPDPVTVREIHYTATDGVANGAWWAHVSEWGPKQAPAIIRLRLGPSNMLYGSLSNITRLRLDLAQSPVDRAKALQVSLDGARTLVVPAPLPESLELVLSSSGVTSEQPVVPEIRPHTPGAALSVYDGSPLLVVYGTSGNDATNAAMRNAALSASRSPNSSWPVDRFQPAPQDGISHHQNLYGELPIKADVDVTAEEIATRHLVLIGTAEQNALVARMADRLPAKSDRGTLRTSDGASYSVAGYAWGLVHYNPLEPRRLILWLASEDHAFYQPGAILPRVFSNNAGGADFIIMSSDARLQAARSFDSSWKWSSTQAQSPLLPNGATTPHGWATVQADLLKGASGADFGVAMVSYAPGMTFNDSFTSVEGVTRFADMAALYYQRRIFTADVRGADLIRLRQKLSSNAEGVHLRVSSNISSADLSADAVYSVAFDWDSIAPLAGATGALPQVVRATGLWGAAAIEAAAGSE